MSCLCLSNPINIDMGCSYIIKEFELFGRVIRPNRQSVPVEYCVERGIRGVVYIMDHVFLKLFRLFF